MKFLTTEEAGEQLGITASQVTLLIRQKKLKGEKFGKAWMISSDDLQQLEERKKTGRPVGSKNKKPVSNKSSKSQKK
jgi:excisionase family DNA binding protein